MKVITIDNETDGHHLEYAKGVAQASEGITLLPTTAEGLSVRTYPYENLNGFRLFSYLRWLHNLKKLVKQEGAELVHFLNGDVLVNYMGLGMGWLKRYRTVFTFHHFFGGKRKEFCLRRLMKRANASVVHTLSLRETFSRYGKNVLQVEYPDFSLSEAAITVAHTPKVLLALGQTRTDKGLDLLLAALQRVTADFRLIVAGAPADFQQAQILALTKSYREKVTLDLRFLPKSAVLDYLDLSDFVVLPYRKSFDGASGPLAEGVSRGKVIVGSNHGSLGKLITENHLGYVFEAESVQALADTLQRALTEDFSYDKIAQTYREKLSPERFQKAYREVYQGVWNFNSQS